MRGLAVTFLFAIAFTAAARSPLTARHYGEDFDAAWRAVDRGYAYFGDDRAAWKRARETWRPRALRAASREELVAVLEGLLATLHDDHVSLSERTASSPRRVPTDSDIWARWNGDEARVEAVRAFSDADVAGLRPGFRVTRIEGVPVAKAVEEALARGRVAKDAAARDWALRHLLAGPRQGTLRIEAADAKVRRNFDIERSGAPRADGPPLIARRIGEHRDIGYMRLRGGLADPRLAGHFAGTLRHMQDTRALLLDLRDANGPASRDITRAILGHFIAAPARWQVLGDAKGARVAQEVAPNGGAPYRAPVVVLVDRWTAGEGEALAAGLVAVARARLVGTAMAGLHGELREVALPHSGLVVRFPGERAFHVDGSPRERLRPHVEVDLAAPSGGPGDPILYQALRLVEN